ncbi:hypothetical protein [Renibacterium salmoninarum]|nr:hypothetical protein [Renibacterium salmoninarum]
MSPAADTSRASQAGFTRITRTALNRVLAAVAADAFGLKTYQVKANATDDAGKLAVAVSVPIAVPSLAAIAKDASILNVGGGDISRRTEIARRELGSRAEELTGSLVSRIDIDLTSTIIEGKAAIQ